MQISMTNLEQLSLSEMKELLSGSRKVTWATESIAAKYVLIAAVLKAQSYRKLGRRERGVVRQFLAKVTATSRAQLTRLIGQWMKERKIARKAANRPSFAVRYRREDIVVLAATDAAHEDLSGPALRRILYREFAVYGKPEYERLAKISVSHLYNLRHSQTYRSQRVRVQHTQSRQIAIGERRKPDPRGQPGYLRVDTVHQGQQDGKAGVFHINAVDTVTQWQNIGCVETISERHMLPVLEAMLHQVFIATTDRNFSTTGWRRCSRSCWWSSPNRGPTALPTTRWWRARTGGGSQAHRLRVHRRRARRGHAAFLYCAPEPVSQLPSSLRFRRDRHRPHGRRKRRYPADDYRTPFEKLTALEKWQQYLKPGLSEAQLRRRAEQCSDTEAARQMQQAKLDLLRRVRLPG